MSAIRLLLGLDCCGPWSPWEARERRRRPTLTEAAEFGLSRAEDMVAITRWRERRCTACGTQQIELRY